MQLIDILGSIMKLEQVRALRGPNRWARFPVVEALVDLSDFVVSLPCEAPAFEQRLIERVPSLAGQSVSAIDPDDERIANPSSYPFARAMERLVKELQCAAGSTVDFSRTVSSPKPHVYRVVVRYHEEAVGREAVEIARKFILAMLVNEPFDISGETARLRKLDQNIRLGPSTGAIVRAAVNRGIPYRRLNDGSLVQFGHGSKQKRIWAAETHHTSAIAETIAQDKELTKQLLRAAGAPTPEGTPVKNAEEAWEAAQDIGVPVVVKPQFGNQGRGVAVNLTTREQVLAAYEAAREEGSSIIVERFAPGCDHRLLVIGNRLVAAARREPPKVTGDGFRTIRELVEIVNQDPRRGEDHATCLSKLKLDDIGLAVLAEQGFTPDTILADGQTVVIRRNANLSTGGSAADITDQVHPDVAARAVDAARVIGLDVAGVDIVATDVRRPLEDQGGVIVEVNAAPGLRMHLEPSEGQARPVGEAIIGTMYPEGENGRVPTVAITGTNGKTTTTRLISHLLRSTGRRVGMTCTEGVYIDSRRIEKGDCSGPLSAQSVLMNPSVEAAVLETARGGILRAGLGFDQCDVAVVTNIGDGDHLGLNDIDTVEQLAEVKRVIVTAVAPTGAAVLNAADPLVAEMASSCLGSVIYFAREVGNPIIARHRQHGGRAVLLIDDKVVVADGSQETIVLNIGDVPLTHNGRIWFQIENVLAATAAAWSLGISLDTIRAGLKSFGTDLKSLPGRFNLFDLDGRTVVIDYGHNVSSLEAVIEAIDQFPHERRNVLYSAAGDRRDEDFVRQGELLGDHFDRVILYEDHYLRGRAEGEIMRLFRDGAKTGSRQSQIEEIKGWANAMRHVLRTVPAGELLLIQADVVDETVDFVERYLKTRADGRQISLDEALDAVLPATEPAAVFAAIS